MGDGVTPETPGLPSHRVKVRLRPHFIQAHYPSGTPSTLILQSPLSKQIPLASSSPIFLSAHALLTPSFHLNGGRPLPLSPSTSDLYTRFVNRSPLIPSTCPYHFKPFRSPRSLNFSLT